VYWVGQDSEEITVGRSRRRCNGGFIVFGMVIVKGWSDFILRLSVVFCLSSFVVNKYNSPQTVEWKTIYWVRNYEKCVIISSKMKNEWFIINELLHTKRSSFVAL